MIFMKGDIFIAPYAPFENKQHLSLPITAKFLEGMKLIGIIYRPIWKTLFNAQISWNQLSQYGQRSISNSSKILYSYHK